MEEKLAVVILQTIGVGRPLEEVTAKDLYDIRNREWEKEKPSFEIHISRAPCTLCKKFVGLLSEITGVFISIRVGCAMEEQEIVSRPLRREEGYRKEPEADTGFESLPEEWPEELCDILTGIGEMNGDSRREATEIPAPLENEGSDRLEYHESSLEIGQSQVHEGGDIKTEEAQSEYEAGMQYYEAVNLEGDDSEDDVQVTNRYIFDYQRSAPPHNPDMPLPSIEEENAHTEEEQDSQNPPPSERTATTPDGHPLRVSPRTHIHIRRHEYEGPSYMPPRELSHIEKPRPTPIFSTPSDIRQRYHEAVTYRSSASRVARRRRMNRRRRQSRGTADSQLF